MLRAMYQQAVSQANIVGLCVRTRPDCVPGAVLDLLTEYREQGYEVWLELGLQTAHDKTLHRINRGHDFACYQRTTVWHASAASKCTTLSWACRAKGSANVWRP